MIGKMVAFARHLCAALVIYPGTAGDPLYKLNPFYTVYNKKTKLWHGIFYNNLSDSTFDMGLFPLHIRSVDSDPRQIRRGSRRALGLLPSLQGQQWTGAPGKFFNATKLKFGSSTTT